MVGRISRDDTWGEVWKALEHTFGLTEGQRSWIREVRTELSHLASAGIATSPDFTLHNETHSDDIVLLLQRLRENFVEEMTPYENYVLVTSAYTHDVGMFFDEYEFEAEILPKLGKLRFCPQDCCDPVGGYEAAIEGQTTAVQIRMVHHLLSAYLLTTAGGRIFHLEPGDARHVIPVSRGHRKANLCSLECDCYRTHPGKVGQVRRGLLAGLLRLADALDFYPDRAPEEIFRSRVHRFLTKPMALRHWLNHYFASEVYPTIQDRSGNRYLDCHITYSVPPHGRLNGVPYKEFFAPLFQEFIDHARQSDFNPRRYPVEFKNMFQIVGITVNHAVKEEAGSAELPDRMIEEIVACECENALDFLNQLEREDEQPHQPKARVLIDRKAETRAFANMLEGHDPQHRLIRMKGDHGQGKTHLVRIFEEIAAEYHIKCVRFDLYRAVAPEDILDGLWRLVGTNCFPGYSSYRGTAKAGSSIARSEREEEATQRFFSDWRETHDRQSVVLILDTYERADASLKKWISERLLTELRRIDEVVVVIGGREWTIIDDYWNFHGYAYPLDAVRPTDCAEYVRDRGLELGDDEVRELHRATEGLPKLIAECVDILVGGGAQDG